MKVVKTKNNQIEFIEFAKKIFTDFYGDHSRVSTQNREVWSSDGERLYFFFSKKLNCLSLYKNR